MVEIMAFGAHPDDVEFGCGGVLCKAVAQGHKVVIVDLTLGDKGTQGTPEIRREEGLKAAKVIGAERIYLDWGDCELQDSYEGRVELTRLIRAYRPKLLLAPTWKGEMNHPDHHACGQLVRYAARYARFQKILPELPVHTPEGVLHYLFPGETLPDFLVDVSDVIEQWQTMMACHVSQLRGRNYEGWNLRTAAFYGVMAGCNYAQGFVQGNPRVVDDIMQLSKGTWSI